MLNKNKIATSIFVILSLFNLLFPPVISKGTINNLLGGGTSTTIKREFFYFIFDLKENSRFEVDINMLIVFLLIALMISVILQGIYYFIEGKFKKI